MTTIRIDDSSMMKQTLRTFSRRAPAWAAVALALSTAVLLQGCMTRSQLSDDGMHDKLNFPGPDAATWVHNGTFPLVESLRKLRPGMTKNQIAALIGRPQYSEGFFGVREWDYRLNVTNEAGAPQFVCQLKVIFNSREEARNYYRKCGDNIETLLDGKWRKYEPPVEVFVPAAMAEPEATSTAVAGEPVKVIQIK
jgi:outer membrane protein assembly factor BamE (lipoprotein component of BamABCDE complex)